MANLDDNIVMRLARGKLGNQLVFRRKGDLTVMANKAKKSEIPSTDKQQAVRTRFQYAVIYGKSIMTDISAKAEYAAAATGNRSAYNVAIADFFNAPDIHEADFSNYSGQAGSTIRIRVTDDFKVKTVRVKISNADGTLVEEGNAVMQEGGMDWIYVATVDNNSIEEDRVLVTATDRPANASEKEFVIE